MVFNRYLTGYPNMLYFTFLRASRRGNKLIKTRVSASSFWFSTENCSSHLHTHVCMYMCCVYRERSVNDLFDNKHSWTHSLSQKGNLVFVSRCKWSSTKMLWKLQAKIIDRRRRRRQRRRSEPVELSACVACVRVGIINLLNANNNKRRKRERAGLRPLCKCQTSWHLLMFAWPLPLILLGSQTQTKGYTQKDTSSSSIDRVSKRRHTRSPIITHPHWSDPAPSSYMT